jgi:uncharacterized protein YbjT (DUF2867 family)
MSSERMHALVVGATGSIGHLVVEEAIRQGHGVRALVRDSRKARRLTAVAKLDRSALTTEASGMCSPRCTADPYELRL